MLCGRYLHFETALIAFLNLLFALLHAPIFSLRYFAQQPAPLASDLQQPAALDSDLPQSVLQQPDFSQHAPHLP